MTVTRGQATQLRDFWYVIARSKDVRSAPIARKLNGRALAVFRDDHGRARVLDAVCPHRGAHLGYGKVEAGGLVCPYHGWRFDGTGRCTHIPSNSPGSRVPPGFQTECFPVVEQQGLIWTTVGTPVGQPPRFPELVRPAPCTSSRFRSEPG